MDTKKTLKLSGSDFAALTPQQLDQHGVWSIYGHDNNTDMGGSHTQPYLGTVEATLRDAITTAEAQPTWMGWGPLNTGYLTNEPRQVALAVVRAKAGAKGKTNRKPN
jgi:hypothetical protein